MTFAEIIPMLPEGKKARRPHWYRLEIITYMRLDGTWSELVDNMRFPIRLNRSMLEATDWEVIE